MKQVWRTEDGQEFDDEAAAQAHDEVLQKKDAIVTWAQDFYGTSKRGVATKAINVVLDWEKNREEGLNV